MVYSYWVSNTMTKFEEFHNLEQFFSGQFHQDWTAYDKEPREVVLRYVSKPIRTKEELQTIIYELEAFLTKYPDETDITDRLYRDLGCFYYTMAHGKNAREWLIEVKDMFANAINKLPS